MSTDPDNGHGHVEGFDESEELTEDDLVTFVDENGDEIQCAIVAVLEHEGDQFVVLYPVAQLEDEELEEIDTYIFRYELDEDGNPTFHAIDDDATFDAVCEAFTEMSATELGELSDGTEPPPEA